MGSAEDLMQRLAVSKKIMEKTEGIQRGSINSPTSNRPIMEDFQPINARYNLPDEFLPNQATTNNYDPTQPMEMDRIKNSKLPDEIKRLMIEQPIVQATTNTSISEDIIQGAQRLMNMDQKNNAKPTKQTIVENQGRSQNNSTGFNMSEMKSMIRDVVRDTVKDAVREELKEAGMLVESSTDANEIIQFKVGKHLFVGKVTKIKKLQ